MRSKNCSKPIFASCVWETDLACFVVEYEVWSSVYWSMLPIQ